MSTQTTITMDDWLYAAIEERRGEMNRSEFISSMIVKGMGLLEQNKAVLE